MTSMRSAAIFLIAAAMSLQVGCSRKTAYSNGNPSSEAGARSYPVKGKVVSTLASTGEVTLNHEAIPGYMDAMTMPYKLRDRSVLSELHPGDVIVADLIAAPSGTVLDHIVVVQQGKPDYQPAVSYSVPEPGDTVPSFDMTNQDGKTVHLSDWAGKVVAVTFIYTRCPQADFCPRMSQNFAKLDRLLAKDTELYADTHLVSISFDPDYDTPKVLRSYGAAYTGRYTQEDFIHWDFAAAKSADLPKMESFFDLAVQGVTKGATPASIMHTLSTAILSPDGKIYRFYPGSSWTPEGVLDDIRKSLAEAKSHQAHV